MVYTRRGLSVSLKGRKFCPTLQHGWTLRILKYKNQILHEVHLHEAPWVGRLVETEKNGGRQGLEGAGVLLPNGDTASVWEGDKVLETDGGDGCTTP